MIAQATNIQAENANPKATTTSLTTITTVASSRV